MARWHNFQINSKRNIREFTQAPARFFKWEKAKCTLQFKANAVIDLQNDSEKLKKANTDIDLQNESEKLKKANTVIWFIKWKWEIKESEYCYLIYKITEWMFGKSIDVKLSSSGHCAIYI